MNRVVIFGATSAVAISCARLYAARGAHLLLIGRRTEALRDLASDLKIRGAMSTEFIAADLAQLSQHESLLSEINEKVKEPNTFLFAYGTLPDQQECESDFKAAEKAILANCLSQVSILTLLANELEHRRSGTIAVISSVAGDRGRQSNYVYGSAKGMLSLYLQGLRNRLSKSGIGVLDVKPGFIDTPMTAHIKNKGLLWASPDSIGKIIVSAIDKKKDTVYAPWFWSIIMLVIRNIPEKIFKRLSL